MKSLLLNITPRHLITNRSPIRSLFKSKCRQKGLRKLLIELLIAHKDENHQHPPCVFQFTFCFVCTSNIRNWCCLFAKISTIHAFVLLLLLLFSYQPTTNLLGQGSWPPSCSNSRPSSINRSSATPYSRFFYNDHRALQIRFCICADCKHLSAPGKYWATAVPSSKCPNQPPTNHHNHFVTLGAISSIANIAATTNWSSIDGMGPRIPIGATNHIAIAKYCQTYHYVQAVVAVAVALVLISHCHTFR